MSKDNFKQLVENNIANLLERGKLLEGTKYKSGQGLVRQFDGGNYQVIIFGTAKEIHFFLEGVQYAEVLNFPTNKEA